MSVRYFIDTEFTTDDPSAIELISIGIVAEDGREYYAISKGFDQERVSGWVAEHVLPLLEPESDPGWRPLETIRDELISLLNDPNDEVWGYSPAYDWFLVHSLFGGWSKLPETMPRHCWDLKQWAWQMKVTDLPRQTAREHHALEDARHDAVVYSHLRSVAKARGYPLLP